MRNNKGITLVELLVALVISSMLLATFFKVFITQNKTYVYEDKTLELSQSLNSAMDLMILDAKMSGYDSVHPASQVVVTNAVSVSPESFTLEFEQDLVTRRSITYFKSGSTIVRRQTDTTIGGSSSIYEEVLLDKVESVHFGSVMNGGTLVGISLDVIVSVDGYQRTQNTQIALRN